METIRWFRRLQLWATGDWQLHHDSVPTHTSHLMRFFWEMSDNPGDQSAPLQARFGALWLLAFPQIKITFEREEISDHQWDSLKIWWGSWWQLGELCEVLRCLLWRDLRHHCPMYNIVFCIVFNKCLFFILHGWIPSAQTSYTCVAHKCVYK